MKAADDELFQEASRARSTSYFWTGILGVLSIAALALVVGRVIANQTRVTKLKNDLVATITHELKTPLASMRLLVDTLNNQDEFEEQQVREYLTLIAQENKRLSRLIDNFLVFSRIERNKFVFDFEILKVQSLINTTIESLNERFHEPNCDFAVKADEGLPCISGNSDALVTVLLNLLDNAYKYSGKEKRIRLIAKTVGNEVILAVEDNGIGLTPREAKRVFRRFYQVDQKLTRSGGGCGLGLSIVQYIVQAHNGTIDVKSSAGEGSCFTVKIPAVDQPKKTNDEFLESS